MSNHVPAWKGITFLALAGAIVGGVTFWMVMVHDPARAFISDFDTNLASSAPVAFAAVRFDTPLHDELLNRTLDSFMKGGWPAASAKLKDVLETRLSPYADDDHVLARVKGELRLVEKLLSDPAKCRLFGSLGDSGNDFPTFKAEAAAAERLMWEEIQNGAERRQAGVAWTAPTPDEMEIQMKSVLSGPPAFSDQEIAAFHSPTTADPLAYCRALIKFDRNLLSLPVVDAAFARRALMMNAIDSDWLTKFTELRRRGTTISPGPGYSRQP